MHISICTNMNMYVHINTQTHVNMNIHKHFTGTSLCAGSSHTHSAAPAAPQTRAKTRFFLLLPRRSFLHHPLGTPGFGANSSFLLG